MVAANTRRRPQQRVIENDKRLLRAAVEVIADSGWGGFSYAKVASSAGLSTRTLFDRFEDSVQLATVVWHDVCYPTLRAHIAAVVHGMDANNPDQLVSELRWFVQPGVEACAAVELIAVAQFDETLNRAITNSLGTDLSAWCTPDARSISRQVAVRRAFMIMAAIGLLLAGRSFSEANHDIEVSATQVFNALQDLRRGRQLPQEQAPHLRGRISLGIDDPVHEAVLQATLELIGRRGYDNTSLEDIVNHVGYTKGVVFARYPSKLELFLDAARRQTEIALTANQSFMQRITAKHGAGIGEALNIRESQRPSNALLRAIGTEQIRLTWHNPSWRATRQEQFEIFRRQFQASSESEAADRASFHWQVSVGMGMLLLPVILPECWKLPWDVVTTPLVELGG